MTALLTASGLSKHYTIGAGSERTTVRAVTDVSFEVGRGETLALVGESGSGKTTTALCAMGLEQASAGTVSFDGIDVNDSSSKGQRVLRRRMQFVFQDPYSSLNPRMTVAEIIREPLEVHRIGTRAERDERVVALLRQVGLAGDDRSKYPHQFSGGQRQRIGIARALATTPELLVCDEPVSALDVSVQAQVINLLCDLRDEFSLGYLFIAHDLAVVRQLADRIAVMYLGSIVEQAPADELYMAPRHPYTVALMSAVPSLERGQPSRRIVLHGDPPSPSAHIVGCPFHTRCWKADDQCRAKKPQLDETTSGHRVACWYPE